MNGFHEDDDLLSGLSKEELDEFNQELNDPENELLPASQRAPDQTLREDTGDFDRDHLLNYLKEEAFASETIEDLVPFEKKTRGRVWKSKEKKKSPILLLPDDLSDVLDTASEDDLIELAAVLGIHGMLTQKQSEQMEADKAWESLKGSGLRKYKGGITKATKTKQFTDINAINELNLDAALNRLTSFDETLTELNLNNHKDITVEKLIIVANNLKTNKYLKTLYLANTQMTDSVCKLFAEALTVNKTLECINLESNYLTRDGVSELLKMLETNTSLKELKLANQSQMMGHQLETKICKTLAKNQTLLRFGFSFQSRGPRHVANKCIMRNNDADRLNRQSAKLENNVDQTN